MSKFTGKSDFYDFCYMSQDPQEIIDKGTVYFRGVKIPLKNEKDLIPYYPFLVGSAGRSDSQITIHLSENSYFVEYTRDRLIWRIEDALSIGRYLKRHKIEFTQENFFERFLKENIDKRDSVWAEIFEVIIKNPGIINAFGGIGNVSNQRPFISEYLIPKFFDDIYFFTEIEKIKYFLNFAKENGYFTFFTLEELNSTSLNPNKEIYNKAITELCVIVANYEQKQK